MLLRRRTALVLAGLLPIAATGQVDARPLRVGVLLSLSGPAASIGIPQRNALALLPQSVGERRVDYTVLDDSSDPTRTVANLRKLATETEVDAVLGPCTSPGALAAVGVAAELGLPMIAVAGASRIVAPMDQQRAWVFKTPQNDGLMADAIAERMVRDGLRTIGFLGFNDAFGDGWLAEATRASAARGLQLAGAERYARTDATVLAQVLKLLAAKPDTVLIAGAGTPTVLPVVTLRERGYAGAIWQTHGAASTEFLKLGGPAVEGVMLPAAPVLVAAQLPDTHPAKAPGLDFTRRYEAANGPGSLSAFGAQGYDAGLLLLAAAERALQSTPPGTPAFRTALRAELERTRDFAATQGVFNMTPQDHNGLDERARVIVQVERGSWRLAG